MSSHKMLEKYILKDQNIEKKVIVEIGTTREAFEGQDSTKFFYELSIQKKFSFTTVDMDQENSDSVKKRFKKINAITMKGDDYIKNYVGIIDYIYLDAFDFEHNNHSEKRKQKYKNILNCEISNELCHKMHLECCENLLEKMNTGGLILIDDVLNNKFDGKGKTAIPFLLENNFEILELGNNGCLLRKNG